MFGRDAYAARPPAQTWLAVKQLGPPSKQDVEQANKPSKLRMLARVLVFSAIFGTEFYVIASENEALMSSFFRILIGSIFQLSLVVFFADIANAGSWVVHRRPALKNYRNVCRMVNISKPRMAVAVAAATAVNAA